MLAERLNKLFDIVRPPGEREQTNAAVAEAIKAEGVSVSGEYIRQLRTGARSNPNTDLLKALASHFGVPPGYLLSDAPEIEDQLETLHVLRDAGIREIALRTHDLSPEGRQAVQGIVDYVRRIEGKDS